MGRRLWSASLSVVCALALGACYGSTEPATDIGDDSATLRAQGTANNGPASSWIEYWTDGDPPEFASRPRTPTRSWPAGASGPISERVTDLLVASEYSFKLCGFDPGRSPVVPVCAQTRAFRTPTPTGDYAKGGFFLRGFSVTYRVVRFNARSGPAGQNPTGTVTSRTVTPTGTQTSTGTVWCLAVSGGRAIVGTVNSQGGAALYEVQDTPGGTDEFRSQTATNPPDCSTSTGFGGANEGNTVVIRDVP